MRDLLPAGDAPCITQSDGPLVVVMCSIWAVMHGASPTSGIEPAVIDLMPARITVDHLEAARICSTKMSAWPACGAISAITPGIDKPQPAPAPTAVVRAVVETVAGGDLA